MRRWLMSGVLIACIVASSGLLWGLTSSEEAHVAAEQPRTPVLVELFTSQGCSSCPPADELLIRLAEQQPIAGALVIPLSEHVEYWNRLGCRDPFSAPTFTERQQQYGDALGTNMLYTPQMVVDGRAEFIGSLRQAADDAIARAALAPKAEIELGISQGSDPSRVRVDIAVSRMSRLGVLGEADLWLAVTEEGLATDVRRGENAHRRLRHAAVVRQLNQIETVSSPAPDRFTAAAQVAPQPDWHVENLRLVAFLQERQSRRVLGVGQARFE